MIAVKLNSVIQGRTYSVGSISDGGMFAANFGPISTKKLLKAFDMFSSPVMVSLSIFKLLIVVFFLFFIK